jgi:hypothetical protein
VIGVIGVIRALWWEVSGGVVVVWVVSHLFFVVVVVGFLVLHVLFVVVTGDEEEGVWERMNINS